LTNVLRQLFASFGTAAFATLLQTRQGFHQTMLAQTVTLESPAVRSAFAALQQRLIEQGLGPAQAKAGALSVLAQQVTTGAAVRSFDDAFLMSAAIMLLAVLPALFLTSTGVTAAEPRGRRAAG
jgi:hypothetical protein